MKNTKDMKKRLPLQGVRVIDFSTAWAGPLLSRLLADYGAEVIKVESSSWLDSTRLWGPFPEGKKGNIEASVIFACLNRNKKSITVNMSKRGAPEVIAKLINISDVVVDNFALGVMEKWGLGYSQLKKMKENIIVMNMQGLGRTGPFREYATYGPSLMCISGMTYLWRFPECHEPIVTGPLPDFVAAAHALVAVTAAVYHRAKTGRGQQIELAQVEALASLMGPLYMDWFVNDRDPMPQGNKNLFWAPYGCYRCKGDERWCVITITSEDEWRRFCQVIGEPPWVRDPKFASMGDRVNNSCELDKNVEAWTKHHTPHQIMRILQRGGVPAGVVQNAEDVYHDPHLRERGFILEMNQPEIGFLAYPGFIMKLSDAPAPLRRPAPHLGQDNNYVFGRLLGLSRKEIGRLKREGIIS
jgi:benzylsuccinate CoA-transferase BbsF subunit